MRLRRLQVAPLAVLAALALGCGSDATGGSPLDQPDGGGYTPLMRAAERGDVAEVRRLVQRGADPNYQGRRVKRRGLLFPFVEESWEDVPHQSWTPLMVAAQHGRTAVVRALLGASADADRTTHLGHSGRTALWLAAEHDHRDAALALLAGGAARSSWATYQALQTAVERGHVALARSLVAEGAGIRVAGDPRGGAGDPTGWSSPLGHAARAGETALVQELLAAGVQVRGDAGGTALRAAAQHGHLGVVRALLAAGAAPDGAGLPVGWTPLGLAAAHGHAAVVAALLEAGAAAGSAQPEDGAAPLALAAERGHHGVVVVLLRHGVEVDATDRRGWTALSRASARGDQGLVELLAAAGASRGVALGPDLLAAQAAGDVATVRDLLARGAPPDIRRDHDGATPLMLAALAAQREIVQVLLAGGADPSITDGQGLSALGLAVLGGDAGIVADLLAGGAVVLDHPLANPLPVAVQRRQEGMLRSLAERAGATARAAGLSAAAAAGEAHFVTLLAPGLSAEQLDAALVEAARAGRAESARALLAAGAAPHAVDARGVTALMWAAYHGDRPTVAALLAAGAAVDARLVRYQVGDARLPKSDGWTALFWAACEGHREAVAALLAARADVTVADSRGNTALRCAAEGGEPEIVQLLQRAGAGGPVDLRQVRTRALLRAAQGGNLERVRELLAGGLSARAADDYGLTALHEAVRGGHEPVVRELLAAGADANARHRDGHTPLWLAEQWRRDELAALLRAAGGRSLAPGSRPDAGGGDR